MKGLVVLICVASITVLSQARLTDEERQRIKTIHDECQSDPATHIDEELMKDLHKGDQDKSIVGSHVLCMSNKLGFQKTNGDIDSEVLRFKLGRVIKNEEKLNKAVEECGVQKTTPEESAIALLKCVHDHTGYPHQGHHHHHRHGQHHHQPNTL